MLEQCCKHSKQCHNSVATLCWAKNRRCEFVSCNIPCSHLFNNYLYHWSDEAALVILSLGPVVENPTSLGEKAH